MDDDWYPTERPSMPEGPQHFPSSGPNSLASFGRRAGARAIDSLLIGLPVLLAVTVAMSATGTSADAKIPAWAGAAWFVAAVLYEVLMTMLAGRTLGKMVMGIKVARIDNGRRPAWTQALIRILVPAVWAALPFQWATVVYFGEYITGLPDPTRRALHDKAAGTVVVSVR